jgi:hypothetical protein
MDESSMYYTMHDRVRAVMHWHPMGCIPRAYLLEVDALIHLLILEVEHCEDSPAHDCCLKRAEAKARLGQD